MSPIAMRNPLRIGPGGDTHVLHEEDFNLDAMGFDDAELGQMLAAVEGARGLVDEDAAPALPSHPLSRLGDL